MTQDILKSESGNSIPFDSSNQFLETTDVWETGQSFTRNWLLLSFPLSLRYANRCRRLLHVTFIPYFSSGVSLTRIGPGSGLLGMLVWREQLERLFSLNSEGMGSPCPGDPGVWMSRGMNAHRKSGSACADSSLQLWGLSMGTKGLPEMSFSGWLGPSLIAGIPGVAELAEDCGVSNVRHGNLELVDFRLEDLFWSRWWCFRLPGNQLSAVVSNWGDT